MTVNLKSTWLVSKAVIAVMREQAKGAIVNISSLASIAGGNQVAYEISKAGVNRLTTGIAQANARHGIRCNAVLPGLMDTPMAVAGIAQATGQDQEAVRQMRNQRVPLGGKMGSGWDTAYAALFLASDEAQFISGVLLPVDGGMSVRIG
jgi:NAD(P)-dependent dehydrogenase (short-subunit alcohol dehydrogenase family)